MLLGGVVEEQGEVAERQRSVLRRVGVLSGMAAAVLVVGFIVVQSLYEVQTPQLVRDDVPSRATEPLVDEGAVPTETEVALVGSVDEGMEPIEPGTVVAAAGNVADDADETDPVMTLATRGTELADGDTVTREEAAMDLMEVAAVPTAAVEPVYAGSEEVLVVINTTDVSATNFMLETVADQVEGANLVAMGDVGGASGLGSVGRVAADEETTTVAAKSDSQLVNREMMEGAQLELAELLRAQRRVALELNVPRSEVDRVLEMLVENRRVALNETVEVTRQRVAPSQMVYTRANWPSYSPNYLEILNRQVVELSVPAEAPADAPAATPVVPQQRIQVMIEPAPVTPEPVESVEPVESPVDAAPGD